MRLAICGFSPEVCPRANILIGKGGFCTGPARSVKPEVNIHATEV
jgi:hypothetical protein